MNQRALIVAVCSLLLSHPRDSEANVQGTLFVRQKPAIEFHSIVGEYATSTLRGVRKVGQEENSVSIPFAEVRELQVLNAETSEWRVVLRNGNEAILGKCRFYKHHSGRNDFSEGRSFDKLGVVSTWFDDLTEQLREKTTYVPYEEIDRLSIGSVGPYRACPVDEAVFPASYLFCPYHKVDLSWSGVREISSELPIVTCGGCKTFIVSGWLYCPGCGIPCQRDGR